LLLENNNKTNMAKTTKNDEKKLLLRLPKRAFEAVKKAADKSKRSVNSEIELAIEEKFL
jgi:hypothetical protein